MTEHFTTITAFRNLDTMPSWQSWAQVGSLLLVQACKGPGPSARYLTG